MMAQRAIDKFSSNKTITPRWLANEPGKRWTEIFFLKYSVLWITFFGFIVVSKIYEYFEEWEYLAVGMILSIPCLLGPLLFPGQGTPNKPLLSRYFLKANLWIFILSFIGNYFWTHYFYNLLGADYTFKAHRLNNVPICLILITQAYFCTYHTLTTILLRRFWTSRWYNSRTAISRKLVSVLFVSFLAYTTAFAETLTIASFPYYRLKNRSLMYLVGSACYGLYFVVTFPMYFRLGEYPGEDWPLSRVAVDSLGACMLVTCLLDAWRLAIGGIVDNVPECVPWM